MTREENFMMEAIRLSEYAVANNEGGPFGCVIVKDGQIIGKGYNQVLAMNDPTAHAEMVAIRDACKTLNTFQLEGCEVFTSCEPCPMCLGAIYWARPKVVYFANLKEVASASGFDDSFIYLEIEKQCSARSIPFKEMKIEKAADAFRHWLDKQDKITY